MSSPHSSPTAPDSPGSPSSSAQTSPLTTKLHSLADDTLRDFNARLVPGIDADRFIGIRMANLRHVASTLSPQVADEFRTALPHFSLPKQTTASCMLVA